MSDSSTTVQELRQLVGNFIEERDWRQFHAPKNLSMALAIEAAELMEHFQWIGVNDSRDVPADKEKLAEVGEELADVIAYALALANELEIDLSNTLRAKMAKNVEKYPVEEFRDTLPAHDHGREK
ncbi:MAG: nucleotide pyrophosphohydrolase [Lacipirellulaceae bacterium]